MKRKSINQINIFPKSSAESLKIHLFRTTLHPQLSLRPNRFTQSAEKFSFNLLWCHLGLSFTALFHHTISFSFPPAFSNQSAPFSLTEMKWLASHFLLLPKKSKEKNQKYANQSLVMIHPSHTWRDKFATFLPVWRWAQEKKHELWI